MIFVTRNKIGAASSIIGLALGAFGLAGAASAALSDPSGGEAKVTICHATGSETDPYNKIEISQSAVDDEGHRNHTGPVWYLGASDAGVRWGDIIPATDGVIGLNWPEGEAVFNNDCIVVTVETTDGTDEAKVTICHATNSETNPYNKITVSVSAVTDGGHRNHTGPVWYPGAKDAGVRWGDIIPPTDGVTAANWPAGESTFNNDCQSPGTTQVKDKTHGPKTTTTP